MFDILRYLKKKWSKFDKLKNILLANKQTVIAIVNIVYNNYT